jgi:hypothetical protein
VTRGTRSGQPIGRPKRVFHHQQVRLLRQNGLAIDAIARQMNLGVGTVLRALQSPSE